MSTKVLLRVCWYGDRFRSLICRLDVAIGLIKYSLSGCGSSRRQTEKSWSRSRCEVAFRASGRVAAASGHSGYVLPALHGTSPLCLRICYARGACVAPPRSRMKGRNIASICNSLRQIDINGDGFNKV